MQIVHTLYATAHGDLRFEHLSSGKRGVTGSEQALLFLAKAQAEAGHDVTCYMPVDKPTTTHGVKILDSAAAWPRYKKADTADILISWLTADPLRNAGPKPLKILNVQINDWWLNSYDFHKHVDVFITCSEAHRKYLLSCAGAPTESRFAIIPNGVDLRRFADQKKRQEHKFVCLSSPDRGLHWLLYMWPDIRYRYPDAELHVYYELEKWKQSVVAISAEIGNRARYIIEHTRYSGKHGVYFHGAVPPDELAQEVMTCDLMLYPCDTVRFTEGFGSAVLEACAAGTVPVITDCDALGEVYSGSGAVVVPMRNDRTWTDRYLVTLFDLLDNRPEIDSRRGCVVNFAANYDWPKIIAQWDAVIDLAFTQR